ncbi:MAG: ABC transporter permease [Firmicutes bacterium]|nr:ABC transporter permease [Bacillota bacterium]
MKQLWSVIRFEFNTFAKNKAFVGMALFLVALALIGPAIPAIINRVGRITAERTIAVVDNTGTFDQATLNAMLSPTVVMVTDMNTATRLVTDGTHNYALELNRDSFTLGVMSMGIGIFNLEHQVGDILSHMHRMDTLYAQGVAPNLAGEILAFRPSSEIITLGATVGDGSADSFAQNVLLAYIMGLVLMIGLQTGGGHLLTVVVREKSTKTMELLVTSCPPRIMLVGKVIGTGAALMLQIIALVVSAAVSMLYVAPMLAGGAEDIFTINFSPIVLMYLLVFFLLGFLMYAFIFAALASTCSRMEDATSMGQIPILLLTAGFIMVIIGMNNPGAAWVPVVSFIPFFSPFVMFMRICMGTAANWEIFVSIAVQIFTIGVISWMAAKIYRMGTLMYGAKPSFKNLLQAFK